ncbi:MAG: signal peptidase I [Candidatus Dasytiphilus stammeri]
MHNKFTLLLTLITVILGIFWICNKVIQIIFPNLLRKEGIIVSIDKVMESYSSIFPILLLVFIIRSFIFEPFKIPSGSMMPTLLIGDYILVEKFSYGLKNPWNQKTLGFSKNPQRGDIVVFQYPKNPKINYIKRIIGLPGDVITYNSEEKKIMIKTSLIDYLKYKRVQVNYTPLKISNFVQIFNLDKGIMIPFFYKNFQNYLPSNSFRMWERIEILDNVIHKILILPQLPLQNNFYYKQPNYPTGSWVVPKGYYFMMGDNRDNSSDSRYWGFVPKHNIIGKAIFIWMSFNKKSFHWLPISIRFNRIGIIK